MSREPLHISAEVARRLIVSKQRLAGPKRPRASSKTILDLIRDLGYVQWDPVPIVAPSHLLSFWARLDGFRPELLERLLWKDRSVFEHWTPVASIVRTADYPLFLSLMRRYPESLTRSWGSQRDRFRRFLATHAGLRERILRRLRSGPCTIGEFSDHTRTKRDDGDWMPSSDVSQMLYHLTMSGEVMVVGHRGAQNLWGPSEEFLPEWADRNPLSPEEFERAAAERSLQALGVATSREILRYFVRGRYSDLPRVLQRLETEGRIHRVLVDGTKSVKDSRFVHDADLPLLASCAEPDPAPHVSLLPPFDNMVYSQDRGQRLFGFDYVREQFLPEGKRRYGLYVLPVLRGDAFVGRVDPRMDRESGTLKVNSVHMEPGAPQTKAIGDEVAAAIDRLAGQLGASRVAYTSRVPRAWASSFGPRRALPRDLHL